MLFGAMEQGSYPDWLIAAATPADVPDRDVGDVGDVLGLCSPKQASTRTGIFDVFPALSYDEEDENLKRVEMETTSPEENVQASIQDFKHRFACLKQKWTSAFQDVEVGHFLVTSDLARISEVTNRLAASMGHPLAIDGTTFENVWQALERINSKLQEGLAHVQDSTSYISDLVEDMSSNQSVLQDSQLMFQNTITSIQETIRKHESRFTKILPGLMNVQQTSASSTMVDVDRKLNQLMQAIEDLQDRQWQTATAASSPSSSLRSTHELDAELRDIKAQLKTLQLRIVGNGVQIGGVVFQCFDDVKSWVVSKFQIRRYGLFVDGVSLLDFFSFVTHTDTEKSMSTFYNQVKSGFLSMYEARLAASTQNLFPMNFGRSNSGGMDDSEYLPALQDPDKWDNGIMGLRYQISRGISDVEIQLESTIDSILKDYPEPRQIAKEC